MRLGVPRHTPKFEAKPAAPLLPALSDGGQRSSARLAIEQADDDVQHDRTPLFDRCQLSRSSFQDRFVDAGKWFRRPRQVERFQARALQRRRFYCQSAPARTSPAFSVSVTIAKSQFEYRNVGKTPGLGVDDGKRPTGPSNVKASCLKLCT